MLYRPWQLLTIAAIMLLLAIFQVHSYSAAQQKSATPGEPMHLAAGVWHLHTGDFRLGVSTPPLLGYCCAIPQGAALLGALRSSADWEIALDDPSRQPEVVRRALYSNGMAAADATLNRSRLVISATGVMLAALIAWWAWDLGGRVAAVVATAMFCFDPNFLAHASLVHEDTTFALIATGLTFVVYRAGQRFTPLRLLAIALLCAGAVTIAFRGSTLIALLGVMLVIRATIGRPWLVFHAIIVDRMNRLGVALTTLVFSVLVAYFAIWASYGFRYTASNDPTLRLDVAGIDAPGGAITELLRFTDEHRLLPQAFVAGALERWAQVRRQPQFLLEQSVRGGSWYGFAAAMLFKTPLATLAAVILALLVSLWAKLDHRVPRFDRWAIACIVCPVVVLAMFAATGAGGAELRWALPLYPPIFVYVAAALAHARYRAKILVPIVIVVICAAVAFESLRAYPDFIPFFNEIFRHPARGLNLLAGSNLDWGQDLPGLRRWQQAHRDARLLLDYSGDAEPAAYVNCAPLRSDALSTPDSGERWIAISATRLQGIEPAGELGPVRAELFRHRPDAVIGGSIYLYRLPLSPARWDDE